MRTRNLELPPKKIYLEKGQTLSKQDAELLEQRIGRKFARRAVDKSRSPMEIVALQLAYEDMQLNEWRERLTKVRAQESATR